MGKMTFWEDSEQEELNDFTEENEKEEFDSFTDSPEDLESEENHVELQTNLNINYNQFLKNNYNVSEDTSEKIQTNMYQYMLDNYEKVMYWITSLAKTPTCKKKFLLLAENSHMDGEDLVQETYSRILKTFYDNEQRLKICKECKHQCKEFLNKTKKTNTEKFANGRTCRPYMYYDYSEKDLHNYINKSLKQNIDIKLKKLKDKNGKRITVKIEEPIGPASDACELGDFLADALSLNPENFKELLDNLLTKKILFINKLSNFSLEKDIFKQEDQVIELENDKYNQREEELKAEKRKVYERYNLEVPEHLRAIPKTIKGIIGKPLIDIEKEFYARFDLIPSFWEKSEFWEKLYEIKTKKDEIYIGTSFKDLKKKYEINLDYVLTDQDIRKAQYESGESIDHIKEAEQCAKLDMLACLPTREEFEEFSTEDKADYLTYVQNWDYAENVEMIYNEKTTEIKIVDKDYKIIPLPLCTYAEVSVQDFLELCSDLKEGYEFFNKIFANSKHITSFKEFWVDFENRAYNVAENIEYRQTQSKRKAIYRLDKKARRMLTKKINPEVKEILELFVSSHSILDQFSTNFINKVCKTIKQYIIDLGYEKYIKAKKIIYPVKKRISLSEEERRNRAKLELTRILELKQKIHDNKIHSVNASEEYTVVPNLNPQELFSSILSKIPAQETRYVLEEVKVLCTSQSGSLKNTASI